MKKLKIQFWKAEKALAMQVLEQEGLFRKKCEGFVKINSFPNLSTNSISLRGEDKIWDLNISAQVFNTNAKRDKCLGRIVYVITDELFTEGGELKVGEMCEVRNSESGNWGKRKLITILPEQYRGRFIVETENCPDVHSSWYYARPITKRIEPKIEECGQLITYTWEEK